MVGALQGVLSNSSGNNKTTSDSNISKYRGSILQGLLQVAECQVPMEELPLIRRSPKWLRIDS